MSKLDHTKVATWSRSNDRDNKTVTGCVSGQPIFFIHKAKTDAVDWLYIRCTAGADFARTAGTHYTIGTSGDDLSGGSNVFVVVPNTTSVTIQIDWFDADDEVYVYKQ